MNMNPSPSFSSFSSPSSSSLSSFSSSSSSSLAPSLEEVHYALNHAISAFRQYRKEIQEEGQRIVNQLTESGEWGIVVLGHPHHLDPEIHHGIPGETMRCVVVRACCFRVEIDFMDVAQTDR